MFKEKKTSICRCDAALGLILFLNYIFTSNPRDYFCFAYFTREHIMQFLVCSIFYSLKKDKKI